MDVDMNKGRAKAKTKKAGMSQQEASTAQRKKAAAELKPKMMSLIENLLEKQGKAKIPT